MDEPCGLTGLGFGFAPCIPGISSCLRKPWRLWLRCPDGAEGANVRIAMKHPLYLWYTP